GDGTSDAGAGGEGVSQDPKAISESLRRIRASGPLIIAAIKQNTDRQSIDRINEIIAQSIQGMTEDKAAVESPPQPGGARGPPPSIQHVEEQKANSRMNRAPKEGAGLQTPRKIGAGRGVAGKNSQALVRARARGGAGAAAKTPAQSGPKTAPKRAA